MRIDKGRLHHFWRKLKQIKIWHLVVLIILFSIITVLALRNNNLQMVELRREVIAADEQGENVEQALENLRNYMNRHMNTRMSEPVQLVHTYEKIAEERIREASQSGSAANTEIYEQAERECATANVISYAQCVIDRTSGMTPGDEPITEVDMPDPALFSYNFYSPYLSFDVAGISLLITILLALFLFVRIIAERLVYLTLKHRH